MHSSERFDRKKIMNIAVIVAALGYFVDIYDLVLFSIIRVPSLKDLGIASTEILDTGLFLLNVQMAGMLLGGIAWGMLGDKKGRLSVLFGSILLYSLANIANGMVADVQTYAVLRFIAGIGLAGELGAGITLVSEILSKEHRGYGTMLITGIGVLGAVLAQIIANEYGWRTCFYIGGGLGLALLVLRVGVMESGMYSQLAHKSVRKGHFISLFTSKARFVKYLRCILIGLPTWYLVGILMTLSPEFSKAFGVTGEITGGKSILWFYLGLSAGDVTSGLVSQYMRSRKKVVLMFLVAAAVMVTVYFVQRGTSPEIFYTICLLMGITSGYWALFVIIAAEQFGTNLRATVATTVPNFVRGALVPIAYGFQQAKGFFAERYGVDSGIIYGGILIGVVCLAIAVIALFGLHETFGKDLDYVET